jgi:hypothetical protein
MYKLAAGLFLAAAAVRGLRRLRARAFAQGIVVGTVTTSALGAVAGGCCE